jgi:hypothetical protein
MRKDLILDLSNVHDAASHPGRSLAACSCRVAQPTREAS